MAAIAAVDAVGFEFSWLVWISWPPAPTNVTIVRVSYQLVEVSGAGLFFTDCSLGSFIGGLSESRDR